MIAELKLIDGLHIVSILLVFASSVIGMLPFWLRIYTPIFMFYHYYPAAMALGLYSCHRFHPQYLTIGYITIIGCLISFVWWCLWLNEYNQAGVSIVEGTRNYSFVAGSNRSLQITTSQSDDEGPIYISMSTLDVVIQCFLMIMSLALLVHVIIAITDISLFDNKCACIKACKIEKRHFKHDLTKSSKQCCGEFQGRGLIYIPAVLGIGLFVYYLVVSVILLVDSVLLINPVASPNVIFVYTSFASMGLPDMLEKINRRSRTRVMFMYTLGVFWLWSLVLSIVQISQLAIWRMDQTPYISETNGICPTTAIVDTLTYSADEEWGNFTFEGFSGINTMTLHNNSILWTPELFATYSCADDSLTLAQIGISTLGLLAFAQYAGQLPPIETTVPVAGI